MPPPPLVQLPAPCSLPLQALDKYTIEKDVAAYIKKEFDAKHNPTWHCIVGRNFGARLRRLWLLGAASMAICSCRGEALLIMQPEAGRFS